MEAAVITGASAGIGEAIASALLGRGIGVVSLQRSPPKIAHPKMHFYAIDLMDLEATRKVAARVAERFPVRYLVNNAGENCPNPLESATLDELNRVLSITLGTALILIQAFAPGMKSAGFGRIVNMTSRAIRGKSERVVYSSAKAGLVGMTRTAAIELGPHGVTVNAIAPGPIATAHFNRGHPPGSQKREHVMKTILVGRVGTPEDISHAAMFLLARESGFITGQTLFVCGGTSVTGTGGE